MSAVKTRKAMWGPCCPVSRETRFASMGVFTHRMHAQLEGLTLKHLDLAKKKLRDEAEKGVKHLGLPLSKIEYEVIDYEYDGEFVSPDEVRYDYGALTIKVKLSVRLPNKDNNLWYFWHQANVVYWYGKNEVWVDTDRIIGPIIARIKQEMSSEAN